MLILHGRFGLTWTYRTTCVILDPPRFSAWHEYNPLCWSFAFFTWACAALTCRNVLLTLRITVFCMKSPLKSVWNLPRPKYYNCVKSVRIRSFYGPYFPVIELNTERYGASLRIQFEWGIRTLFTQCISS